MNKVKRYKYESEGGMFTYVIISELPEEDRDAVEWYLRGATVPVVPGVGDVAYSWDYDGWISKHLMELRGITVD